MAQCKSMNLRDALRKLFSDKQLRAMARKCGAMFRLRKIDPVAFFWAVVLGFDEGRHRSIAGLRRSYEYATGQCVEESSFYQRFNAGFASMLEAALVHALAHDEGIGRKLRGHLSRFVDVLIADSTVLRLHDLLASHWQGCWTNHTPGAAKLHWVMSVMGRSRQTVKLTSERRHDGPVLQVGPWVKGRLMLFDLGYYGFSLFERIERNGGYFISRLKSNANPLIKAVNRAHRGRSVDLVGQKLQAVLPRLKRETLDVDIEVCFKRRCYRGQCRAVRKVFRLVGMRNPKTDEYHLYITNIGVEAMAAEHIGQSYALRWEVELLFKELKSHYRLDDLPSRKPQVVKALIYAAVLTMLVSRCLQSAIRRVLSDRQAGRLKNHRWAVLMSSIADDLLMLVLNPPCETRLLNHHLQRFLLHEALDSNVNRLSLLQSAEAVPLTTN